MSQSATLYRISKDTFEVLFKSGKEVRFDSNSAKDYVTFQGSFMALEYILSKDRGDLINHIVGEIFNPTNSLGASDVENMSIEEQIEFYENYRPIPFLDPETVSEVNRFISEVSEEDIHSKFDAQELNDSGIYPEVWHNDNSSDQVFNERHLLEDFGELRRIFKQAERESDYILVFVG